MTEQIVYKTREQSRRYAMQYRIAQLEALVLVLADELGYRVKRDGDNGWHLEKKAEQ